MENKQDKSFYIEDLQSERLNSELRSILDCIQDGVFITDGSGNVLAFNKASMNLCMCNEAELVGKNMQDLLSSGVFEYAVSLKAIEQKKIVSEIQKGISGRLDILATATPLFSGGEIALVVVTERDITDLTKLQADLARYEQEVEYYKSQSAVQTDIVFNSTLMAELLQVALRIAVTDATVLIQGESGTGKSMLAKFIHKNSPRSSQPFIEINCGAIPDNLLESELFGYEKGAFTGANDRGKAGLFELANGGTLFLDEIGTMPLHLQVKILRAIQEKEVIRIGGSSYTSIDIRVISATNTDLVDAVRNGSFRKDLYYRLNVCQIEIPPLRNRKEDILALCEYFLNTFNKKYNTQKSLSSSALKLLSSYLWPGNIRELENLLERIVVTSVKDHVTADHISNLLPLSNMESLHHDNSRAIDLKHELDIFEKKLIQTKSKHFQSVTDLAIALNIDKSTATRKLKKYNIKL